MRRGNVTESRGEDYAELVILNIAVLLADLDARKIMNAGLAPFVAVGTITSVCVAAAAFAAKVEASLRAWSAEAADAYLQAMINEGVAVGAAASFWPVAVLIASTLT